MKLLLFALTVGLICFILQPVPTRGLNIRSPNINGRVSHESGLEDADADSHGSTIRRAHHRKVKTVIEISEDQKTEDKDFTIDGRNVQYQLDGQSNNDLEKELEDIFSEHLDHWDRMLQVNSLPPTKSPTSSKPPTSMPAVEDSSNFPSYVPTMPPVADTDAPTKGATPKPTGGTTASPTPVGSSVTDAPDVVPTMAPPSTIAPATKSPTTTSPVTPAPVTITPTASGPTPGTPRPTTLPATTWDIILSREEDFSILIAAAGLVGFDEALQNDEDRTVFAPNNDAFNNLLPADLLNKYFDFDAWTDEYISRLLFCHDIAGSIIFSFQFQNGTKVLPCFDFVDPAFLVTTPPLQISKDTMPEPANVTEGDLLARNGVVHIIDQVLTNSFLRLALPAAAAAFGGFEILLDLVVTADLLDLLSGPGPFTVFAPTDQVFLGYGEDFVEGLKADPDALREILLNHVVADVIIPCCQEDEVTFESAAGFPLVLSAVDSSEPRSFTVNGVGTIPTLTGLLASNGKVNTISDILFLPVESLPPIDSIPTPPIAIPTTAPVVSPTTPPVVEFSTTWEIITSRPEDFATFIAASEAIGFDTVLKDSTERTIFVPNEEAFGAVMPSDLLAKYFDFDTWTTEYVEVLLYCHELTNIVVLSTDLSNGTIAPCVDLIDPDVVVTLPPPRLSKETMPEPADIVEVDLTAENGVVHVIDQVITNSFLRYDVIAAGTIAGGYSILLELLVLTGLDEFASGPGPFTIFAPPNEVFESYGQEFIDALKADINGTTTVLLNHVVPNLIIPCCLGEPSEFVSAAGETLILDNFSTDNPSEYTVNGIATIPGSTDLLTSNSKVNTISNILFPVVSTNVPTASPSALVTTLAPTMIETTSAPTTSSPTNGETPSPSVVGTTLVPTMIETTPAPTTSAPTSGETPTPSVESVTPVGLGPTGGPFPATVWDVIIESPDEFATFISAAESVGYDEILRSSSEITVFAPNEDAFVNLMPPNLLTKYFNTDVWTSEYITTLLSCHDIAGAAILTSELFNGAEFANCKDLLDPEFRFTTPPPSIEKNTMPVPAVVVVADQESLNGVVHAVDQVLTTSFLRFDMPSAAEELRTFTILLELVVLTDLLSFVSGEGPFTIFAPSDSVFQRYGPELLEGLKLDVEGTRDLLLNHVVPDQIVPCCLSESTEFTSAAGFPLVIDSFSSGNPNIFQVNGVNTVPLFANFLTSNAKLTEIDDFLLPPNV